MSRLGTPPKQRSSFGAKLVFFGLFIDCLEVKNFKISPLVLSQLDNKDFKADPKMAELITWLFTSRLANLKLLQLLCAFLTILFLIDGQMQWKAYSIIFISVIILAIVTAITLVFYFLRLQSQVQLPWVSVELLFNAIAAILCFVFVAILVYDFVKMAG